MAKGSKKGVVNPEKYIDGNQFAVHITLDAIKALARLLVLEKERTGYVVSSRQLISKLILDALQEVEKRG